MDGDSTGAALDVLPLDDWHRARGARMVPFAGTAMPVQYDGIIAEHQWTRQSASLFDVSHMGQLQLAGPGAAEALERLVPGDIAALPEGRMRYTLLLAEDGGILDDLMVANGGGRLDLVVNGATKWDDIAHLREQLPDAIRITHLAEQALLALQGPQSAAVLGRLGIAASELEFLQAGSFAWNGIALAVSRSGYTGEDGFEISLPAEHAAALADALVADPAVRPAGLGARDSLRLEAGLPLYGHDLDPAVTPVTAGLAFAIGKRRRRERGFPGAERILRELAAGPPSRRVGLAIAGRQPVREGAPVLAGGEEVGRVTSGTFSPTLGRPIAMGQLLSDFAAPGTPLELEQRGRRFAAEVVPLPFVPHRYHRKEGR